MSYDFTDLLPFTIDDYAKDGGQGEILLLCSFYHEPLYKQE